MQQTPTHFAAAFLNPYTK